MRIVCVCGDFLGLHLNSEVARMGAVIKHNRLLYGICLLQCVCGFFLAPCCYTQHYNQDTTKIFLMTS